MLLEFQPEKIVLRELGFLEQLRNGVSEVKIFDFSCILFLYLFIFFLFFYGFIFL